MMGRGSFGETREGDKTRKGKRRRDLSSFTFAYYCDTRHEEIIA
jgi:hypothetical protein